MANDRRGHLEIGAAPRLARRTRVPEEGAFAPPLGFAQLTTSLVCFFPRLHEFGATRAERVHAVTSLWGWTL
jgi:hypothetical protein